MTRHAWTLMVSLLLFVGANARAATSMSTQDYDFFSASYVMSTSVSPSVLYVAKDPASPSGIAVPDLYNAPSPLFYASQSWSSSFLGLTWSTQVYNFLFADFNADGRNDIFMQSKQPGVSHLLLADREGKFHGITQSVADGMLGLNWSARDHALIAGDFNGDGRADLFFQATTAAGLNAIVLSAATGPTFSASSSACFAGGPHLCWSDSSANPYLGLKWSANSAVVVAGDFNGDQKSDLFVQAKPKTVMIDFDVAFAVPMYPEKMNAVVLSQSSGYSAQFTVSQLLSRRELGVDWSPQHSNIVVGNFGGDGSMDIILQSRRPGQASYLLTGNSVGQLATGAALGGANWSADATRLATFQYDGVTGLLLQSTSSGGTVQVATFSGSTTPQLSTQVEFVNYVSPVTAGHVPGGAGVTINGEAVYSVPIELPDGINGLTPRLSLTYRHDAAPGILGPHWSLSGLSSIKRCPATVAQDGFASGIGMQKADKYCLEGNKLKLASGTYGNNGSTYRTELESYALISAFDSTATGPGYFTVNGRDGLTYEYGNTVDSAVKANIGGTQITHTWALSAIRDRSGNYISFEYVGGTNGQAHPRVIRYGGNSTRNIAPQYVIDLTLQSVPAGQSPFNLNWIFGAEQGGYSYLSSLHVFHGTTSGGGYRFGYSSHGNGAPSRQLLTSIQRCSDTFQTQCMPPTTLEWSTGVEGWDAQTATIAAEGWDGGGYAGDINGDGYDDLYYPHSVYDEFGDLTFSWRVLWGSANGPTHSTLTTQQPVGNAFPIDLDGDGRLDLLMPIYGTTMETWWWLRYQDNGTFAFSDTGLPAVTVLAADGNAVHAVLDVDGDGYQDLVSLGSNRTSLVIRYHNRDGSPGLEATTTTVNMGVTMQRLQSMNGPKRTVDVDGDGRNDLIVQLSGTNYTARVAYSNGTSFVLGETFNAVVQPAYVNADHCTDLLANTSVWISKCQRTGNAALNAAATVPATTYTPTMMDWNGDGYEDRVYPESGFWYVSRSTGAGYMSGESSGLAAPGTAHRIFDFDGNTRPDVMELTGTSITLRRNARLRQEMVTTIVDGYANRVSYDYAVNATGSCYTGNNPVATAGTHLRPRNGKRYVVCGLIANDGIGGEYTLSYDYQNARVNPQGRGFVGFARRAITDSRTGIVTTEDFNQGFPYIGMVTLAGAKQADQTQISQTTNTLATKASSVGTSYPYVETSIADTYEVGVPGAPGSRNGAWITRQTTTTVLNDYGSPTSVTVQTQDKDVQSDQYNQVFTRAVGMHVVDDAFNWCLGRPDEVTITETIPGGSRTQKQTAVIDYAMCRATRETTEPDTPALKVITDYEFAAAGCGNVTAVSVTGHTSAGTALTARRTQYGYGTPCLAPEQITNPAGEVSNIAYRYELGLPWYVIDPNGSNYFGPKFEWQYDDFGRRISELRPDGTKTTWGYSGCSPNNEYCGVPNARMRVDSSELGTDSSVIRSTAAYYDGMGRYRLGNSPVATGALSYVNVTYDALGRIKNRSEPYLAAPTGSTQYDYDILGRQTAARLLDGAGSTLRQSVVLYAGRTQELTNPRNFKTQRVFDAIGNPRRVIDPSPGGTTSYGYSFSSSSLIATITDSAGNVISTTTNPRGFKSQVSDPDLGVVNFVHNSLGEPESQTDARNKVTSFGAFDTLGRPTTRVDPDGEGTTTWVWGQLSDNHSSGKYVGRLKRLESTTGYSEGYFYDAKARLTTTRITLPGEGVHDIDVGYDSTTGLVSRMWYPTSTSGYRLQLEYTYQYGIPTRIRDFNDPSTVFWQLREVNARGQSTREQLGADAFAGRTQVLTSYEPVTGLMSARQSGTQGSDTNRQNLAYLWDSNGNLERRTDLNQSGLYESFVYDGLDRLDYSTRNGSTNLDMTYSAIGNITRKSDVSSSDYVYTGAQSGCSYYSHSQPHAVRRVDSAVYCYDASGNMTNRNGASITWNSRNLPTSINGAGGASSQFLYGPGGNRWKHTATYSGGSETTVYIGDLLEKVTSGTTTYYRHYIAAGSSTVIYTRTSTGTTETYHVTGDHLGSFSSITNSTGALIVSESFDAFGKRRGANWSGAPTTPEMQSIANTTRHGYTGHEHLDNLGLIHMNGRVQDPTLGRFISADPFLVEPGNSQNLNRYSYVYNNPLTFTDPSGFDVCLFQDIDACGPVVGGDMTDVDPCRNPDACSGPVVSGAMFLGGFDSFSAGGSEPSNYSPGSAGPSVLEMGADGAVGSAVGGARFDPCAMVGGGDGGTAARAACYFVNDPNVSLETKRNVAIGGLILMTGGTALSVVPEAIPFLTFGLGVQGLADGLPLSSGSVRVGRWMSEAEHNAMVATRRVQESTLMGVTSVSSPPNPSAWIRQTTAPRYVEFDVPAGVVRPSLSPNAKIYGPSSIFRSKLGISEMPPASNITWTACRVPMTCAAGIPK